jgi:hypothetical protein
MLLSRLEAGPVPAAFGLVFSLEILAEICLAFSGSPSSLTDFVSETSSSSANFVSASFLAERVMIRRRGSGAGFAFFFGGEPSMSMTSEDSESDSLGMEDSLLSMTLIGAGGFIDSGDFSSSRSGTDILDNGGDLGVGDWGGGGDLGIGDLRIGDVGTGDVGTGDVGTGDVGTGDVGTGDVGTGDVGTGDVGTGDVGTGDVGTGDVGTGDVGAADL